MNTKALRQKILDLAIHGKLVPQDPNDEPASVLLKRIKAEKERLIKEGKIKRAKRSKAACDKPHYPFELPKGWAWTTLGDICCIKGGKRIPRGMTFAKGKTAHVYLRVTDMKDNTIKLSDLKYVDDEVYEHIKNYTINASDLYLTIAGTIGSVGIVPNEVDGMNLTENAVKLTHISCIKEYLLYALLSTIAQEHFISRFHQVAQPKLSIETVSKTPIAMPPIGEQDRIVKEIKRCLAAIKIIEEEQTDLEITISQTKSRILDLAIHGKLVPQDPTDEPASELLKRINPKTEIACDNTQYGKLPSHWVLTNLKSVFNINPKNKADNTIESGFVSMVNINEGFSNKFAFEVKRWGEIKSGFTHFSNGDIAVAKISPCLENRKSMVLKRLPNGIGAGTTELHVFRPLCVDAQYGLCFFKSNKFIKQCVGTFNGVVGQQRIGKGVIEEMYFPLPPLNEQHRIAAKIEELFAQLDNIASSL